MAEGLDMRADPDSLEGGGRDGRIKVSAGLKPLF